MTEGVLLFHIRVVSINYKYLVKITSLHKYWLLGFTETEGSFYLVSKTSTRIVHAFEITQKLDPIVLKAIALILGISVSKKNYIIQ